MKKIFLNADEKRLRAGWRIFIFMMIFWSLSAAIFVIKPLFGEITKKEFIENYSLVIVTILAIAASLSVFLARKFLDKQSFDSLGLEHTRRTIKDLVFGFFLSAVMAGLFFAIMIFSGLVEFSGMNINDTIQHSGDSAGFIGFMSVLSIGSLAVLLLETMLVGYWEELVFRGYLLQNMIAGMGTTIAIIVSCLLYGLVHSTNPNAGLLSSLIIVLFGYLRIYGYLTTNMLWLSMGMHIGWNFFQGPVFGFAASGQEKISLMNLTITGPDWLSGGKFGPEGSIIIIPIIVIAIFLMRWWTRENPQSISSE